MMTRDVSFPAEVLQIFLIIYLSDLLMRNLYLYINFFGADKMFGQSITHDAAL